MRVILISFVLLCLSLNSVYAVNERAVNRKSGNHLVVSTTTPAIKVLDNKYNYMIAPGSTWSSEFVNHSVTNVIRFGVNHESRKYFNSAVTVTLNLSV